MGMNAREKFVSALKFKRPDGVPFPCLFYGFHPETVRRWQREGLPRDVHLVKHLGLERCDLIPVNVGPFPHYEPAELEEMEEWRLGMDRSMLVKVKEGIEAVEERFPIKDSASCKAFSKMLNPSSPARYPRFWDDYVRMARDRNYPLGVYVGSPLSWLTEWIGLEGLASNLENDPPWIEGFADSIASFVASTLARALRDVSLDFALFMEPRAYRLIQKLNGDRLDALAKRTYGPIASWVKGMGVDLVGVQASGYVSRLLDIWVGAGMNFMSLEAVGGSDVEQLRERFANKVAFVGNVDQRALAWSKRDIAEEVRRKMTSFELGGFIPAPDHTIMPDVSWENFRYYMDLVKGH